MKKVELMAQTPLILAPSSRQSKWFAILPQLRNVRIQRGDRHDKTLNSHVSFQCPPSSTSLVLQPHIGCTYKLQAHWTPNY